MSFTSSSSEPPYISSSLIMATSHLLLRVQDGGLLDAAAPLRVDQAAAAVADAASRRGRGGTVGLAEPRVVFPQQVLYTSQVASLDFGQEVVFQLARLVLTTS